MGGEATKISIQYKRKKIHVITAEAAFDCDEWQKIAIQIEGALTGSRQVYGRGICFSLHVTNGSWRGAKSGIQILPAPETKLPQNLGLVQHPFMVELPILESEIDKVTLHRRWQVLEETTRLFNLLLAGRTTLVFGNGDQIW